MNIAELRKYGSGGRPRTARAWFDRLDNEEREVVAGVLLSQTAPVALDALREHANFPFKKTALKELRYQLEKESV